MIRCPQCGVKFDYREAHMDDTWRQVIELLATFERHSRIAFEYVELFGVNPLKVKADKVLRLLQAIADLINNESFVYKKKHYQISKSGIVEALQTTCNKHFERPLENHTYLKKVMITISEREGKEKSIRGEKVLRAKEERIMLGVEDRGSDAEDRDSEISAAEFMGRRGIEKLAATVGREMP